MAKYLLKANIYAQLSEIVEANSEKEVIDKIKNQKSFEIKQEDLQVYPSSIEIRKIKEKKREKQHGIKRNSRVDGLCRLQGQIHCRISSSKNQIRKA